LEVSVVDKDGNLCPKANLPINIKVEGSGKMLGAANADACCLIPFQSLNQQTFNGKMTIVVEGSCNVTVSSDGLPTTSYRVWNW
jgi:beta-galactosidase